MMESPRDCHAEPSWKNMRARITGLAGTFAMHSQATYTVTIADRATEIEYRDLFYCHGECENGYEGTAHQRILTASRGTGRVTERDGWDRPESDDNTIRNLGGLQLQTLLMRWPAQPTGPNIAVSTDAKSSGASLPSTLVPGVWASGITLSAHHAPRTSLGGGKVVVSHTPSIVEPVKQHRTLRAQQLPERSTRTQHLAHAHAHAWCVGLRHHPLGAPRTSLGGGKVLVSHTPSVVEPVKQHRTLRAQQLPERSTRTQHAHAHARPPLVPCTLPPRRQLSCTRPGSGGHGWMAGSACVVLLPNSTPCDLGHGGCTPPATAVSVGYESLSDPSIEPLSDSPSVEMVGD